MKYKSQLVGLILVAGSAAASDIIDADFSGTDPGLNLPWTATTQLATNLTFSGWTFGNPAMEGRAVDHRLGFAVNGPSDTPSTLNQALSMGHYLGMMLTPSDGQAIDFGGLEVRFSVQRDNWHAPRRYAVFWSLDGFQDESAALYRSASIENGDYGRKDFQFFIPFTGYDGVSAPVEIRIYAYDALFNHGTSLARFGIASFDGNVYHLTTGAEAGGAVTSNPDAELLGEGTTVAIHAAPDTGYHFAGWSGDVTGLGNPLTLTMSADTTVTALFAPNPAPAMEVGTNLGGIVDWGTHWVFTDMFKRMRNWIGRNADGSGGWDSGLGYLAPLDTNGWPTQIPFDPGTGDPPQIVHTTVVLPPAIDGDFTMTYEGRGTLRLIWDGGSQTLTTSDAGPHTFAFAVDRPEDGVFLELRESLAADPLRNFHIALPGFASAYETEPFHPLFLERLAPFTNLRFMDWGRTNASPLTSWSERTTPQSYTQARSEGVALEHMAALANALRQDPWICIPHRADDDYVRRTARLLRDAVDPALQIYVEYSNETWNTAGPFPQTTYVQDEGEALGLNADRWAAGQFYVALRSVAIWEIFREEFRDDPARVVKVMASHSANVNTTRLRVQALNDPAINPNRTMPDAFAIAPYFGTVFAPQDINGGYPSVDELVTSVSQQEIAIVRDHVRQQKAIADAQGAALICYEGGQHFVGVAGAENDTTLTNLLLEANRDDRMYDRYLEYLDMLEEEGVTLFSNFSFCSRFSKWGSWGVLEYQDQPVAEAPKYRALRDWINAAGGGATPVCHSADRDCDYHLTLSELLRGIQLYNAGGYRCDTAGEDGFAVGAGALGCGHHSSDYSPADGVIDRSELLRLIQLYHLGAFAPCGAENGEDGFCAAMVP